MFKVEETDKEMPKILPKAWEDIHVYSLYTVD